MSSPDRGHPVALLHRARIVALVLFAAGIAACGTILGIGDPIIETEAGVEGGKDSTTGGGNGDGRADVVVADASNEAGEDGQGDALEEVFPPDSALDGDAVACPSGQTICSGTCTDLTSDPYNCNACGTICPQTQTCVHGVCLCPTLGDILCTNGCIDPMTDPNNCNTCGTTCIQGQSCVGGSCVCPSGQTLCAPPDGGTGGVVDAGGSDGGVAPQAGYCADLSNDNTNCNTCGTVCPKKNDSPTCVGSACTVGVCDLHYADCNNQVSDGCETYTLTDNANCGQCNHPCTGGSLCSNGACVFSCPSGQTICNTTGTNYCATLPSDPQNCGTCGTTCASKCVGNATAFSCASNNCSVASCQSPYYDVDGLCANGCECKATTTVGTCASPIALGTLSVGGQVSYSANLVPAGTEVWVRATLTGNTNFSYHPRATLAGNPNNEFIIDVFSDCSGTSLTCLTEATKSTGDTDWEVAYSSGAVANGANGNAIYIPPVGNGGTIIVHVKRAPSAPVDCNQFTLVVSN